LNLLHPDISLQDTLHLLRSSVCMQSTYQLRTMPPSVTMEAAQAFKASISEFIVKKFSLPEPTDYAKAALFLPMSLGGIGLQDPTVVARTGYFASIAGALPLLSTLNPVVDEDGTKVLTWRNMFASLPGPDQSTHPELNKPDHPQYVNIKANLAACFQFFDANDATALINQTEFLVPSSLDEFEAIFKDGIKGGERLQKLLTRGILTQCPQSTVSE